MNRFFWKITICLVPLLLSALVVGNAFRNYYQGKGGFKLGVDLVGGTILIYEVDIDKFPDGKLPPDWNPQELARRLKSRIDPGDLFNITVRVASNTRFEIILPTGGSHQMDALERAWQDLLEEVEKAYPLEKPRYSVKVGDVEELVRKVTTSTPPIEGKAVEAKEVEKLVKELYPFDKTDSPPTVEQQEAWKKLLIQLSEKYRPRLLYGVQPGRKIELLAQVNSQYPKKDVDEIRQFIEDNYKAKDTAPPAEQEKAWNTLLEKISEAYPLNRYVVGRGKTTDLASQVLVYYRNDDLKGIVQLTNPEANKPGRKKGKRGQSMSQEQVQERKELIAQVGSLEFKILANETNDREARGVATRYFEEASKTPKTQEDLARLAFLGKPPPPPVPPLGQTFDTPLGSFTYSWVELGTNYRYEHGLANPRDSKGALIPPPPEAPKGKDNDPDYLKKKEEWDRLHRDDWERALQAPQCNRYLMAAAARKEGRLTSLDQETLMYSREVPSGRSMPEKDREKVIEYFVLTRDADSPAKRVTGDNVSSASPGLDGSVQFRMKPSGAALFQEFTSRNKGHLMAIVLDGYVESAATIQSAISTNGQITGNFTPDKIEATVKVLRSGALPATLKSEPVSESTMGPTLGADTIRMGATSVIWAFVAVLAFMVVYYRFAGLVACVALFANLLLTLAFMVAIDATFTLPGLAGLVLMLGMAVDANILIYERLREERERGVGLAQAIRNGYDHALPTIIDTHLSSIFTAIVLYVVGNDQLKGFGISLTVGLIISLFTSLYMTRLMFDYWLARGWLKQLSMFRLFRKPNINFMAIRYYWFTATMILTILGAALFIYRLPEGSSGTIAEVDLKAPLAESRMNELLKKADLPGLKVEPARKGEAESKEFSVATTEKNTTLVQNQLRTYLVDEDGKSLLADLEVSPRASQKSCLNIDFTGGTAYGGELIKPVSIEKLRALLEPSGLPDLSVEQIFISAPDYVDGDKSKLFTVRTAEKNVKVVQDKINKYLVEEDGGSLLKRVNLARYEFLPDNKEVYLEFTDPTTKKPTYASRAQVSMLLTNQLKAEARKLREEANSTKNQDAAKKLEDEAQRLEAVTQQFSLEGLGKENEGRFQWMAVHFPEAIKERKPLEEALKATQVAFRDNPQPERLENFDSQLAQETQLRALYAILASWGAILLYLWFRFGNWTFGLAAVFCLIHDLFFTLGIIAGCYYVADAGWARAMGVHDFKIDLPAVAALLTLVGYSVNDTIVVFDRIREVRGKNPNLTAEMINASVNQTLSRTVLASLATWLVVLVLYIWGGEGVHLFAFVMVVGVVVGTYSSIYIASPLLLMFGEGRATAGSRDRAPAPTAESRT